MHQLAIQYSVFALIATVANLTAQELVVQIYPGPSALYFAIFVGTAAGLVCKYALDKRYIFQYATHSAQHNLSKFIAYTATGIATTAIFWGFELGFEFVFANKLARYTGACLGLAIGYGIKYRLDKRFVFI